MKVTLWNALSGSSMASPAPDCMKTAAPALVSLSITEGTNATLCSPARLSLITAILIGIENSVSVVVSGQDLAHNQRDRSYRSVRTQRLYRQRRSVCD